MRWPSWYANLGNLSLFEHFTSAKYQWIQSVSIEYLSCYVMSQYVNVGILSIIEIPNPDPQEVEAGRATVYDTWLKMLPGIDSEGRPTGTPL